MALCKASPTDATVRLPAKEPLQQPYLLKPALQPLMNAFYWDGHKLNIPTDECPKSIVAWSATLPTAPRSTWP